MQLNRDKLLRELTATSMSEERAIQFWTMKALDGALCS